MRPNTTSAVKYHNERTRDRLRDRFSDLPPRAPRSAMAAVLDGGFQHLVRELGQSIPDGASLQMAKLVPVVSNSFGSVAGVGDWGGYQMMRVGDGGACRALFQVVGLGGG